MSEEEKHIFILLSKAFVRKHYTISALCFLGHVLMLLYHWMKWFLVVLDVQPRPPMNCSQGPLPEQPICQGRCLVMDHLTAVNGGDWHENNQHRGLLSHNLWPCCIIKSESLGNWHWPPNTRAAGDNTEGKHSCDQMKWTLSTYQQLDLCVYCNVWFLLKLIHTHW